MPLPTLRVPMTRDEFLALALRNPVNVAIADALAGGWRDPALGDVFI